MEITPYANGIHSLAESLRCLDNFLKDDNNQYLMKEAVIKSHHGLETLFKDILFQKNPIFLLSDSTSVKDIIGYYKGFYEKKNSFLFDEAKTITPSETIQRLKDLKIISGIAKKDYLQLVSSFEQLNSFRNQMQHFAIKANPESIIRLLGNLIPRAVKILKNCYSELSYSPYIERISVIPHKPLQGMEKLFDADKNIESDLNYIFPHSTEVIAMLESKYDILFNNAIQKFKSIAYKNLKLNMKIVGHGSSFMPKIVLDGWINAHLDFKGNLISGIILLDNEKPNAIYDVKTVIHQPIILVEPNDWNDLATTKNRITINAKISVLNPAKFFNIPDVEEYIQFIKSPEIILTIDIEYEGDGMFNDKHFDISTVKQLSGKVFIEISSLVYGDSGVQPSIKGTQEFSLDPVNTSISFHSFVESNKMIKDRYSFEIDLEGGSDLVFE